MTAGAMTLGDALGLAEEWTARGVPAFPIAIGWDAAKDKTSKRPLNEHGHLDATTDRKKLRLQFNSATLRAGEEMGVGVRPGPAGYFALDVDGDGDVEQYESRATVATYTVTTASGSKHYWHAKPGAGGHVGNGCKWPEVDVVRGDDGWVVAPGVRTSWGSWESFDAFPGDVVEAPAELWDAIEHGTAKSGKGGSSPVDTRGVDAVLERLRTDGRDQDADALEVLVNRYKGHHPFITADGEVMVTRPDKLAGVSASVGYSSPGVVKMFTSLWDDFEEGHRYVVEGDELVDADELFVAKATIPRHVDPGTGELVAPELNDDPVTIELFSPDGHHYSDVGNADRLIAKHGDVLRFAATWGRWLVYGKGRWRRDHADTLAAHLAAGIGRDLLRYLPKVIHHEKRRKVLIAAVRRAESSFGVTACLKMASTRPGVAIDHEALDADPWLFNVRNGTVDLRTGQLRPHAPADLLTMQADVTYDPDAAAPRWSEFIARVLPDAEVAEFVQRLCGLALLGDQPEHVLPIALGNGANGKSTLTKVIADVLGDYAIVASRDVLLALKHDSHPTAKADLFRRRFAHSGELPPGARLDEAQVKELTGGDRIKARRMREDYWEFNPSHLLWLHANHRPSIEGTDDGIWRRVLLIPFSVQIPTDERDPRLADTILRHERSGILRWMLDGLADYLANGLGVPEVVRVATGDYRRDSDVVARFLAECGLVIAQHLTIETGELLGMHGSWFASAGINEPEKANYQRVVQALKEAGATPKQTRSRGRFWNGVGAP